MQDVSEKLILALDLESEEEAEGLVRKLEGLVSFFKVGIILDAAAGRDFSRRMVAAGKKVFLDLKYYDTPQIVRRAVALAASQGVSFLTVHGDVRVMEAAVEGRGGSPMKLLAVTVLTSMDEGDLLKMGMGCTLDELVAARTRSALELGCDGVICSGHVIELVRNIAGDRLIVVTPGIRTEGSEKGGQKRALSPRDAIKRGADYLVVGRPIYASPNPRLAAERILEDMGGT